MGGVTVSQQQIVRSYRNLYRRLLQAVQFSTPARYVVRDQLRRAFRSESAANYDHEAIGRTLIFLQGAAETTGIEHHILRNILRSRYFERENLIGRVM